MGARLVRAGPFAIPTAMLASLAKAQTARPWTFVFFALLLMGASVPFVMQLRIDTSMVAMLPEERESVQDLEAAQDRLRGARTLTIAAESARANTEGLRRGPRE